MTDAQLRDALGEIGPPVLVASFPRSGTHLLLDTLRRQFPACASYKLPGERNTRLYLNVEQLLSTHPHRLSDTAALRQLRRARRPLLKTHALPGLDELRRERPAWAEWVAREATVLYVWRDVRAVLCSYHLLACAADPAAAEDLGSFIRSRGSHFLPTTLDAGSAPALWAEHRRRWLQTDGVTPVSHDALVHETRSILRVLGERLAMEPAYRTPLLPRPFRGLWHSRLAHAFHVRPASTAILLPALRHRREDWRRAFSPDDLAFIAAETVRDDVRLTPLS